MMRSVVRFMYKLNGSGLPRLAEAVRHYYARRHPEREVVINDFLGELKFACRLGEHMGSQIYWRGAYSGDQLQILKDLLAPGDTFLDLGANQGEFTVAAAAWVGARGRVYAFEPVPALQARLKENISLNEFGNVMLVPCAVSDHSGVLDLYAPKTLYADGSTNDGLPTLFAHGERTQVIARARVIVLDEWVDAEKIERIDVIKLDIEGAELPALRGAEKTVACFRPKIILEINEETCAAAGYSNHDLVDWLVSHGYRLWCIGAKNGLQRLMPGLPLQPFQNIYAEPASP